MSEENSVQLGQFRKILDYDKHDYSVIRKEKIQDKQIEYEAINNTTGLRVTYTNKQLFFSHFKETNGAQHA